MLFLNVLQTIKLLKLKFPNIFCALDESQSKFMLNKGNDFVSKFPRYF